MTAAQGRPFPPLVTTTKKDGSFEFPSVAAGEYVLSAEKSGALSRAIPSIAVADGDRKHIDLVLIPEGTTPPGFTRVGATPSGAAVGTAPSAQAMSFSDAPTFTVAGVTDWTAVGGHGSDAILRTSEDLARETTSLKAQAPQANAEAAASPVLESKLRASLASAPGSFAANHDLGHFYLQAGRYREALPLLEAAYRIEPANPANERDLALCYRSAGDWEQARKHIQHLLVRNRDGDLSRVAGDLDEKLGDPLAAVQDYRQAVQLDPSEANYLAWGSELLLHRAIWQATEVFRSGVAAHPKSAQLLTGLGTSLFAGAVYDEAAQRLCEASDVDAANLQPYIFMGKVDMAAPAPLPCIESRLARFVREKPENSLANYFYAMALWKRNQLSANKATTQRVKTLLQKAVAQDEKCFDGYLQLGILAASERDYATAVPLLEKATDIDPQLSEAHYRLGIAYDHLGEREKAEREFQLHDQLQKQQAAAIEQQRREVKQFVVEQAGAGAPLSH